MFLVKKHNLEIKGIFFPSLILASDLNALFEGVCLLWDSVQPATAVIGWHVCKWNGYVFVRNLAIAIINNQ